jgi:hypothetical protein
MKISGRARGAALAAVLTSVGLLPMAVPSVANASTTFPKPTPRPAPAVLSDTTGQPQAQAQPAAAGAGTLTDAQLKALAKMTQNPVGNIAVLPFQSNWNYAAGPTKITAWNLNIQPVVPVMLSPKLNLIERVIAPVVNLKPLLPEQTCVQNELGNASPCGSALGFGNIQLQSFFAPKVNPNGFIYGYGPIFSFPTVTKGLGTQQFGAGINAVGLVMPGDWVLGILVTQRWYVAGPSDTAQNTLNSFLAQPFINLNFGKGWALSEAPVITANWNEPGNQKWTVPLGLAIINTNTWLKLPMSYQLAYYGNVVRPTYAPYGLIRFSWSIIWPVKRGLPGQ